MGSSVFLGKKKLHFLTWNMYNIHVLVILLHQSTCWQVKSSLIVNALVSKTIKFSNQTNILINTIENKTEVFLDLI